MYDEFGPASSRGEKKDVTIPEGTTLRSLQAEVDSLNERLEYMENFILRLQVRRD